MFKIATSRHIIVALHALTEAFVSTHSNKALVPIIFLKETFTCKYTFSSNSALVLLLLCVRLMIVFNTYLYIDNVEVLRVVVTLVCGTVA